MGLDHRHVRHSLGCPPNAFPDLLRGQRLGEWVQSSVRDFVGAIKINLKHRVRGRPPGLAPYSLAVVWVLIASTREGVPSDIGLLIIMEFLLPMCLKLFVRFYFKVPW